MVLLSNDDVLSIKTSHKEKTHKYFIFIFYKTKLIYKLKKRNDKIRKNILFSFLSIIRVLCFIWPYRFINLSMKNTSERHLVVLMYIRKLKFLIRIFLTYKLALRIYMFYYKHTLMKRFCFFVGKRCCNRLFSITNKCNSNFYGERIWCYHFQCMVTVYF